jgi:hypothetical protein
MFSYPGLPGGPRHRRLAGADPGSSPGSPASRPDPGLDMAAASYVPWPAGPWRTGAGPGRGPAQVCLRGGSHEGGDHGRWRGDDGSARSPPTSPSPCCPWPTGPMMEHVVNLLRQHGFEDIVVTVAFMANAIRTYFGDGSEFGVRMVYATEATPLGTAGSVRTPGRARRTFLVISGDVLTDIDLTQVVAFHDRGEASATWPSRRWTIPSNSASSSPTRTEPSSASSRSRPGDRSSATPSTPGSTCSSRRSSTSSPRAGRWTSPSESFPSLAAGKALFGYVADGYWEDVGTLEAYLKSHQDILDEKVQVDISGFPLRPRVWLGKGAEIDPSVPSSTGPAVIGDNCHIGAGHRLGRTAPWVQRAHRRQRRAPAHGGPRQHLSGLGGPHRRQRARRGPTSARGSGARRGWSSATSASWAPTPRSKPG